MLAVVSGPSAGVLHLVSVDQHSAERSTATGRSSADLARLAAHTVPAGRTALREPSSEWEAAGKIWSADGDGATLQWNAENGVVRVCDNDQDGASAYAEVSGAENGVNISFFADGYLHCDRRDVPVGDGVIYVLKVCLVMEGSTHRDGERTDCNQVNSDEWPDTPVPVPYTPDPRCEELSGGSREFCENPPEIIEEWDGEQQGNIDTTVPSVPDPPSGPPPGVIDDYRDGAVPELPEGVSQPLATIERGVAWVGLGGCVVGFMIVGARMAIKHRQGEVEDHLTGLAWVVIASIVVGSSLVVGLLGLIIDVNIL
ncbi:hypothetical protein [Actinomadura algeriensis]|uniref:hypothetical protein n=1 Tax=Actinomadura algeriensis TaxID=1679523 RepID=UPI001789CC40|nr:hypothetical protein [Actinomadura algeriensis]